MTKHFLYFIQKPLLKSFSELDSKLMFTKNYALVIEVFLIDMSFIIDEKIKVEEKEVPADTIDLAIHIDKLKEQTAILKNEINVESQDDFEVQENIIEPVEEEVSIEVEESIIEPVVIENEVEVPKQVEVIQNVEVSDRSQISILDILRFASNVEKQNTIIKIPEFKKELENMQQFGLSKFFDFAEVTAAGEKGILFTIDEEYLSSYEKRIIDLEKIIFKDEIKKIIILDKKEWLKNRNTYIEKIKNNQDDIYTLATQTFEGIQINKI